MPLEESYDGDIRHKDLEFDSPFNTYRYKGLPPDAYCGSRQSIHPRRVAAGARNSLYILSQQERMVDTTFPKLLQSTTRR